MKLELWIDGGSISVQCELPVSGGRCTFALARSMEVRTAAPYTAEDCKLEFRPPMTKYTFEGLEGDALSFSYAGSLEGILLYVQEEVIHFSLYNGWYPMGFDADTVFDVTVHMDHAWELVNGSWDPAAGVWRCHAADPVPPDCNILLIHRAAGRLLQSGGLRLWYFAPEHEAHARLLTDEYTAVAAFYRDLYGHGGGLAETNKEQARLKHTSPPDGSSGGLVPYFRSSSPPPEKDLKY